MNELHKHYMVNSQVSVLDAGPWDMLHLKFSTKNHRARWETSGSPDLPPPTYIDQQGFPRKQTRETLFCQCTTPNSTTLLWCHAQERPPFLYTDPMHPTKVGPHLSHT